MLLAAEEALELARRVVAVSPADETEVTVDAESDAFVRFADVGPTQSADRERVFVAVRARVRESGGGYREARAVAGGTDEGAWRSALERALELARAGPVDAEALPLAGPVQVRTTRPDEATLSHPFEDKAAWVRAAVGRCVAAGLRPAGLARTSGLSRAIASSAGRAVCGAVSRACMSLTATGAEEEAGFGSALVARAEDLDAEAVVERAAGKALRGARPRPLPPGEYPVLLEPAAVSALLLFAAYRGFGAREVEEQASFLCGRIGERVLSEAVTIRDDVAHPAFPGIPFDGEGTPKETVVLVDGGRLRGPVTDRRHAERLGLPCTGHARPQPSARGPAAENLVVSAGRQGFEQLVAGIERGLLVSQLHYTNLIDPRELVLTGMTRNGTFLIENGEVRHAVKNLRFTDGLVRALGRVSGVGAESEVAGALFEGEVVTPALALDGLRFTSTTDF